MSISYAVYSYCAQPPLPELSGTPLLYQRVEPEMAAGPDKLRAGTVNRNSGIRRL